MNKSTFQQRIISLEYSIMYSRAMSLTKEHNSALDLLQESYFKAFQSENSFKSDINIGGWFYTIMKNTFINTKRRERIKKIEYNNDCLSDNQISLWDKSFISSEELYTLNEIKNKIAHLDSIYTKIVELYVDGYKYNEISEILSLPLGTVKSRIYNAKRILKNSLRNFLDGEK